MGRLCESLPVILLLFALLLLHQSLSQGFEESESTRWVNEEVEVNNAPELHCSRERSRAAWQIIQDYLTPFVERERYQIPKNCRLHPDNDLYRDQEQHKIHVDVFEWKCGYCKKSFNDEKFLDKHFSTRHYNLLNTTDTKCLADLCGALHCDFVLSSKKPKTKCNPAAVAKNRHLCESVANSCFPVSQGPSASRLHEHFLRQFCDAHTCTGKDKPFPRGGKKKSGVFYLAISILTLMLLPLFYLLVFLYQREKRSGTQELRRIRKTGKKPKPS
ncbi:Zinc finger C2H2-type [Arabidopsis suecica]|uniref:Zinc finger C2H2-type n=1 Tax=Arabidopsis suecica TaxID=45249 RepID=A0A8T1Y7J5_ARASU|nr:Zinc finger C2H2-type [Arabidopsis suecica]